MNFISHHKKLIALVAVFSFMYLVGISTMPLRAETATANDQQPGAIEKYVYSGSAAHKSSPIIPILIGVVVVGAVAAVLILVVFKTKYDITGVWYYDSTTNNHERDFNVSFTGTKKSGTLQDLDGYGYTGTYTVSGTDVTIHYLPDWGHFDFIGTFNSENQITGTVTGYCNWCVEAFNGVAVLTRSGTAGSVKPVVTSLPQVHLHR